MFQVVCVLAKNPSKGLILKYNGNSKKVTSPLVFCPRTTEAIHSDSIKVPNLLKIAFKNPHNKEQPTASILCDLPGQSISAGLSKEAIATDLSQPNP